jgi:hypothetical protein
MQTYIRMLVGGTKYNKHPKTRSNDVAERQDAGGGELQNRRQIRMDVVVRRGHNMRRLGGVKDAVGE